MRIMETLVRGRLALSDATASVQQRLNREDGASAIEYALLVGLIAVFLIGALTFLGGKANDTLSTAGNSMP